MCRRAATAWSYNTASDLASVQNCERPGDWLGRFAFSSLQVAPGARRSRQVQTGRPGRTKQDRPAVFKPAQNRAASPASTNPPAIARYQIRPETSAFATQVDRPPSRPPRLERSCFADASEARAPSCTTRPDARATGLEALGAARFGSGVESATTAAGSAKAAGRSVVSELVGVG